MTTIATLPTATTLAEPQLITTQVTQADVVRLLVVEHEQTVQAQIDQVLAESAPLHDELTEEIAKLATEVQQGVRADVERRAELLCVQLRGITQCPAARADGDEPPSLTDPITPAMCQIGVRNPRWPSYRHGYRTNGSRLDPVETERVDWAWWEIVDDWVRSLREGKVVHAGHQESATVRVTLLLDQRRTEIPMLVDFAAPARIERVYALSLRVQELERQLHSLRAQIADPDKLERQMHAALTRRALEHAGLTVAGLLGKSP